MLNEYNFENIYIRHAIDENPEPTPNPSDPSVTPEEPKGCGGSFIGSFFALIALGYPGLENAFYEKLEELKKAAEENDAESVVTCLMDIVPTYHRADAASQKKVLA